MISCSQEAKEAKEARVDRAMQRVALGVRERVPL
jgi:hypothetical protein